MFLTSELGSKGYHMLRVKYGANHSMNTFHHWLVYHWLMLADALGLTILLGGLLSSIGYIQQDDP